MRMRFTCGEQRFEIDVASEVAEAMDREDDVFALAGARPWPKDDVMDWDCIVDADKLRQALAAIRSKFKEGQREQDYVYSERSRAYPGSDLECEGSGILHGFHIRGEIHALRLGLNTCQLERWRVRPDGKGEIVATEDARHLKFIDTDDIGRITIMKRKVAGAIEKWISRLLKRLQEMQGDIVVEFA